MLSKRYQLRTSILNMGQWVTMFFCLASGLLTALILRKGIWTHADSWAYWEGSVSLLEKGRFTYFGGEPIVAWPPMYALFLAAFQWLFGVCGLSLLIATIVLVVINTFSFILYANIIIKPRSDSSLHVKVAGFLAAVFVVVFLQSSQFLLSANQLQLIFVPIIIVVGVNLFFENRKNSFIAKVVILSIVEALALLTHNSSIIFIPGVILFLLMNKWHKLFFKLGNIILFGILSLTPWWTVRVVLKQTSSHPIGLGCGKYSAWEYLVQLVRGFGNLFIPDHFGQLGLVFTLIFFALMSFLLIKEFILHRYCKEKCAAEENISFMLAIIIFIGIATVSLYGVFNLVYASDPLAGRYLWFLPLSLAPVILLLASRSGFAVLFICGIILLACPVIKTSKYAAYSGTWLYEGKTIHIIRPEYFMSDKDSLPRYKWLVKISPPIYSWQKRSDRGCAEPVVFE